METGILHQFDAAHAVCLLHTAVLEAGCRADRVRDLLGKMNSLPREARRMYGLVAVWHMESVPLTVVLSSEVAMNPDKMEAPLLVGDLRSLRIA